MDLSTNPITKLSLVFIRRFRVTLLIIAALLILGAFSYTTLLKREGFPAISIPTVLIQTNYFVDDPAKIDTSITQPIESAINDIPELEAVNSTTSANSSTIRAQFIEGYSAKDAVNLLRDEIDQSVKLPEGASLSYSTFSASAIDGRNDLIFSLSADKQTKEVQVKAQELAKELKKLSVVQEAKSLDLITTQTNPITGQSFELQSGFNRIGVKDGDQLLFDDAVGVGIVKKGEIGTLELSEAVREKIETLQQDGRLEGYTIVYGGDLADSLKQQITSLESNAVAAIIVIVVVLAIMISWRASLVLALFLPLTMGAVFLALYLIGYSLNTISLFALILVLGLFVDDGTIVVEAIDYYKQRGKKGVEAVATALDDIAVADISGTLTTLLVFVPMLFIGGILGDFIELIPVTVILALGLSLIFALTVIPYLTNLVLPDKSERGTQPRHSNVVWRVMHRIGLVPTYLVQGFAAALSNFALWYLKRPVVWFLVFVFSIGAVVLGVSYAGKLPFSVFPAAKDTDALYAQISYPDGYTIEQAQADAKRVEDTIAQTIANEVRQVTYVNGNLRSAYISIDLTPLNERDITSVELVEKVRGALPDLGETSVKIDQVSAGPTAGDYPFSMQVYSEDQQVLDQASTQIRDYLDNRDLGDGEMVTDVRVDNLGLIAKRNGRRYVEVRAKISDPTNTGLTLKIQDLVKAEFNEDKIKSLGLETDALGYDLGQESENLESFQSAVVAFGIALLVMYGLLVLQFNSFTQPALVFIAIPFSFPGLFWGLYATSNSLSFFVMVGIIALAGIVVNNSIILLEYANQAREKGGTASEAIAQAIKIRLRPMLTTTATTVGGLLPLALTEPFWESLAFTIVFGLLSSLIIVLLAFPAYYVLLEKLRSLRFKRKVLRA